MKTYVVTPHLNRLVETVRMMGQNIRFKRVIRKISPNYPFYPFLSGALYIMTEMVIIIETVN